MKLFDYAARGYYATILRFGTVDPKSEKYHDISPDSYCLNNPVNNIDPNGMDVWSTTDPEEIRRAIESLLRGGSFQYNSNWMYRSDRDFLNPYGDSYYPGLNYNSRTGQLWFLSGGMASDSYVSQLTRISKGMWGNSYAGYGGWYDNAGVYITGAFLTAEDIYNNYYHNHSTYTTTKDVVKNIYKANGEVRSARAAQFARTSMTVKILGTTGTALMTAQAGTKIYNGSPTAWDYGDFTVGSVGTVAGFAELIGGASYAVPGLGEAVAAYAWFRLWYDLGAQYGPSKWYGNDDTRWFK